MALALAKQSSNANCPQVTPAFPSSFHDSAISVLIFSSLGRAATSTDVVTEAAAVQRQVIGISLTKTSPVDRCRKAALDNSPQRRHRGFPRVIRRGKVAAAMPWLITVDFRLTRTRGSEDITSTVLQEILAYVCTVLVHGAAVV